MRRSTCIAIAALSATAIITLPAAEATAGDPAWTKNCTALNKKYPHGVGKRNAHDHTSGTPVTTFKRSNKLYSVADTANGGLDRDNDGIACEKA
jgi:hypothetical protein